VECFLHLAVKRQIHDHSVSAVGHEFDRAQDQLRLIRRILQHDGERAVKAVALDSPARDSARGIDVPPRPRQHRFSRAGGLPGLHDRQRHLRIPIPQVGAPAFEHRSSRRVHPRGAREFGRRRARHQLHGVEQPVVAVLEQVGAEVLEQHEPADDEEDADQERRYDADENVGEDQLLPDAPKQALAGGAREPQDEDQQRAEQDNRRDGVENGENGRKRGEGARDREHQLDGRRGQERAAGERAQHESARLLTQHRN
jgi:hypothetical protein